MTPAKQPTKSSCGQTVVAMLFDKKPEDIGRIVGHMTYTNVSLMCRVVEGLGGYVESIDFHNRALPELGMVRVAPLKRSGGHLSKTGKTCRSGHFLALYQGKLIDPWTGVEWVNNGLYVITHVIGVLTP